MPKFFLAFFTLFVLLAPAVGADFEQDITTTGSMDAGMRELQSRAVAGDANAQLKIGSMLFKGEKVTQNFAEAANWFRLAAAQGQPQAQYNLGLLYDTGKGVTQNHVEAVSWYRKASDKGVALAQLNLGVAYATGMGVSVNGSEAVKWIRMAAIQGEPQAQFNLAVMYAKGQWVEKSYTEAYRWAMLAQAQGHESARKLAQELSSQVEQPIVKTNDNVQPVTPQVQPVSPPAVVQPAVVQPVIPVTGYYLQLSAFKTQAEVDKYLETVVKKIGRHEQPLSVFTYDGWMRTQLGPFASKEEAHRKSIQLKEKLGYPPLIKQH
jgi:cell division septation protein DedD